MTESGASSTPAVLRGMIRIFRDLQNEDKEWELCGSDLSTVAQKETNIVVFHDFEIDDKRPIGYEDRFLKAFFPALNMDINGSYHCQYAYDGTRATPRSSWSCYKIKEVTKATEYKWKQPALYIKWCHKTGRQMVYIFNLFFSLREQKDFLNDLPSHKMRQHSPFYWHAAFACKVLEQYDTAFWMVRNLVRNIERDRTPSLDNNEIFPSLHDIARHLFHYQETIAVAEHTLRRLVQEHARWSEVEPTIIKKSEPYWLDPHQDLLFQEKAAHSLLKRSKSLNERHLSEINLNFNLVSQGFGRAARDDTSIMKTIAFVSMVYLPGTFVSSLFGTNFFSFQTNILEEWRTSSEFWIYWAVTIPLTLMTLLIWLLQPKILKFCNWLIPKIRDFLHFPSASRSSSEQDSENENGIEMINKRTSTAAFKKDLMKRETTPVLPL